MGIFLPEGMPSGRANAYFDSPEQIEEAMEKGTLLEGLVQKCDSQYNLVIDMGIATGVLPFKDSAIDADKGRVREISVISKVNKPVCFVITSVTVDENGKLIARLSRRAVQEKCVEEYVNTLHPGDVIDAAITHFEPFGVFVDIGCGIVSLLPIDCISVSRIAHPRDRFSPGQHIKVIVSGRDQVGRITLTHKELLGTWAENAADFSPGDTVIGTVRSVESYGIFIELKPNLAGLAEKRDDVRVGDSVSVYIKSILPDRMKIKLIIIDRFESPSMRQPFTYYTRENHISHFLYSPPESSRLVETVFDD